MYLHKDENNNQEKWHARNINRLCIIFLLLTLAVGSFNMVLGNENDKESQELIAALAEDEPAVLEESVAEVPAEIFEEDSDDAAEAISELEESTLSEEKIDTEPEAVDAAEAEHQPDAQEETTELTQSEVSGTMPIAAANIYTVTDASGNLVGRHTTLAAAVADCTGSSSYTVTLSGDEDDLNETVTIPAGTNITLTSDANGPYTITQTLDVAADGTDSPANSARHLEIAGNLTMKDVTLAGLGYAAATARYNGGVYIADGGSLTLETGVCIERCINSNGGGVYVDGGDFKMTGGEISCNTAGNGGGIYVTDYQYTDSLDTIAYANLAIDSSAAFAGNTATNGTCYPPENYDNISNFDGQLLNNADISYASSYSWPSLGGEEYVLTYIANNGNSADIYQETLVGGSVIIKIPSDVGFTAPLGRPSFVGWNKQPDGSGEMYYHGDTIDLDSDLELYGIWYGSIRTEYYTLDNDQQATLINGYYDSVDDVTYTIDTSTAYSGMSVVAWYYTSSPNHDVKYYFEDVGNIYTFTDDNVTLRIYAVSSQMDVLIPNESFFWYVNEDTSTSVDYLIAPVTGQVTNLNGTDVVYEIRSKAYSIQNRGTIPVTVELEGFGQNGSRSEVEELLQANTSDMLFLNLTGDLAEEPLGLDLLKQESSAAPFGVYTEPLGSGEIWQYSFGGFYYPDAGQLPGTGAISDYTLTFNFALDLSEPEP